MEINKLLTTKDIQEQLGIGRDVAYGLMKSKTFPSFKLKGRYYVTQPDLQKFLENVKNREIAL